MIDFLRRIKRLINPPKPYNQLEDLKQKGLIVGENFDMMGQVIIDFSHCWHITIGDNVTLAPRVHILAHDASTRKFIDYTRLGKVKIGNNVFVGAASIILPGVTIGDNVVIGAGSVVTKSIDSNSVVAGNPAKYMCSIDEYLEKRKKEISQVPVFSDKYSLRKNVTPELKKEMNDRMTTGIGYNH
ncbi:MULTISPECIES: DapH/DapD/GlmU-related protein [unclassified Carboxylicivirga]|uniref:DapH/DapD/GlmU-related protein n=1 Tax=Carboxylicivirga TaxID=1628153 RepID=UPI003D32CAEB